MMKKFDVKRRNFIVFVCVSTFVLVGCSNEVNLNPKKIRHDRDVCERCKMILSTQNYACQVINPTDGKYYNFDDIGCSLLWFKENNITWEDSAIIYVADAVSSSMINARESFWVDGANTPMNFGYAAHSLEQENRKNFNFEEVKKIILEKRNV